MSVDRGPCSLSPTAGGRRIPYPSSLLGPCPGEFGAEISRQRGCMLPPHLLPLPLLPLYRCIKNPFESNRVKQALGPLALPAALLCTGGAARIWHTHVRPVQSTSPSPLPTSA